MAAAAQKTDDSTKSVKIDPSKIKWCRVKTPTVFQMEAVECGAAALAMVMSYHGKFVSLAELRQECGVSRDGSKASNMVKAARRYGFIAKGFKKENLEDLKTLKLPQIVFWNFNHFIVLEGKKRNRFYVNDPATGPRTMTLEDFDMGFSGVVLEFEPGPDFEKSGNKPSIIPGLLRRLKNSKAALAYVLFINLFMVIPGLIIPACSRIFVDNYLIKRMDSWVKPLLIAMALTAILRTVLSWLQSYYYLRFETKLASVNSSKFFWHVFRLPVEFFNQRFAGEIASRVAINDQVAGLLAGQLAGSFVSFLMVIFYAVIMFDYDWILTLVCFLSAAFNIIFMKWMSRQMVDKSQRLQQEGGKLAGISMGGLNCIETLKASGGESDFFSKWSGYYTKLSNSSHEMAIFSTHLGVVPSFVGNLTSMAILGLGGMRVMDGHLTMGMLVAFQSLMSSFMGPVMSLVGLGTQVQQLQGGMNRLDDVLNNEIDPLYSLEEELIRSQSGEPSIHEPGDPMDGPIWNDNCLPEELPDIGKLKLTGAIELRNVTFGYSTLAPPLIENFNLRIEPGQRVAFVGSSGCGKSTLAKLICGLYQPWSGEILFDGRPMSTIGRGLITSSMGMVNQDILLFEGTLRENLTLWDTTVPDENVVRAAKDARIHDDISIRAGGYDSLVKEGGVNFSGGQRQRVEIARALVNDPTILVLDEATSALDPATEERIDENLRRRGCTCVIVAHRLSTIRDCDEIVVLVNGKVVQRGSHEEMRQTDGAYARLIAHE
ncbi:MAG: NHLP family bacteriocin export ABC transporter peptidase/permease/ATPase subunit [Candidatus Wallbacteria bacterium HGW-Wallbacteria-1]|jgi:NHLM bacteriocin system ABC transporter peptidase/ATP-binding protein|uniref:NHLP family bacteriocin export ABC transporter peptidase/permease/ATPase subunit n=1 Tax=Candidatus Wallbacteria bacterium HGW-Wallbacteria-1 TaxID=2013854 RepID=A0A2N1PRW6_9BACT|nr:MAG: NHLP family bacteriocin export ABC transporter peptidase/permease/ATPase subunit [Candidatus Wallbacteria bacterium HGW-Wallbacteria-1]